MPRLMACITAPRMREARVQSWQAATTSTFDRLCSNQYMCKSPNARLPAWELMLQPRDGNSSIAFVAGPLLAHVPKCLLSRHRNSRAAGMSVSAADSEKILWRQCWICALLSALMLTEVSPKHLQVSSVQIRCSTQTSNESLACILPYCCLHD